MIEVPTEDLRLMLEAGYFYLAMNKTEEARTVFEGVALLLPNSEVPLVALGSTYFNEAKLKEAVSAYQKALKLVPDSAFAMAYLGEALFFSQQNEEAIKNLQAASKLDPEGKSGDFARSLLKLIDEGFKPPVPTASKEKSN